MENIQKLNELVDSLIEKNLKLQGEKEQLQKKIAILLDNNDLLYKKNKDMILEINKTLTASFNNAN
jgi:hypothetical protein